MRIGSTATSGRGLELERSKPDERLAQLYASHARSAARLALLLTGDDQAAQDITQEAFVRVGSRLIALRDPDNAAGYLYRTVHNLAKAHGRSLQRQRRLNQRLEDAAPRIQPSLEPDDAWRSLMQLPLRQRTALYLRYYLDLSESDAARALECSVSAVKSLTHRATENLKRHLQGEGS